MNDEKPAAAIEAVAIAPRSVASIYPAPFAARMTGRSKRALGDHFGLKNFGVNLTRLAPARAPRYAMHIRIRTSSSTSWKAGRCW